MTITIATILEQLDRITADSEYEVTDNHIDLIIYDFLGFDEDWSEVFRDLVDEDAVEEVLQWLGEHADRVEHNLYHYYYFGDIEVEVGYTSFDI